MIRKFKILGALLAVAVTSAAMTSSASATFKSSSYPYTASGTSTDERWDAFGSMVKCISNSVKLEAVGGGKITEPAESLTLKPTYSACTAFGLPATVNMTGCDYVLKDAGATALWVDIVCPGGVVGIDINVYAASSHTSQMCHVNIPAQALRPGANAATNFNNILLFGGLEFLTITQSRTSAFCPAGVHTNAATQTIQWTGITLTGTNGAIWVD